VAGSSFSSVDLGSEFAIREFLSRIS